MALDVKRQFSSHAKTDHVEPRRIEETPALLGMLRPKSHVRLVASVVLLLASAVVATAGVPRVDSLLALRTAIVCSADDCDPLVDLDEAGSDDDASLGKTSMRKR